MKTHLGGDHTYEEYTHLLLSSASVYDSNRSSNSIIPTSNVRDVYAHEYNIDTPIEHHSDTSQFENHHDSSLFHVNRHDNNDNRRTNSKIPRHLWEKLD